MAGEKKRVKWAEWIGRTEDVEDLQVGDGGSTMHRSGQDRQEQYTPSLESLRRREFEKGSSEGPRRRGSATGTIEEEYRIQRVVEGKPSAPRRKWTLAVA